MKLVAEDLRAGDLVEERATTYVGRWVVSPSGGSIAAEHRAANEDFDV